METLIERDVNPAVDLVARPDHGGVSVDAVVVRGLTKSYGDRAAVDDLSFSVPAGSGYLNLVSNSTRQTNTNEKGQSS